MHYFRGKATNPAMHHRWVVGLPLTMRILRFSIALLILTNVLGNQSFSETFPYPSPTERLFSYFSTPADIAQFLNRSFIFKSDETLFGIHEYWQTPEEFLGNHGGDCEDYALFTQYFLNALGYEAFVVSLYGENYAHTVTIFRNGNHYDIMNEDRYHALQSASIEDALNQIHENWSWAAIAERRDGRGWMTKKLLRTGAN